MLECLKCIGPEVIFPLSIIATAVIALGIYEYFARKKEETKQ